MLLILGAATLIPLQVAPAGARTEATARADPALQEAIARRSGSDFRRFYQARANRPVWIDAQGQVSPAAKVLLRQVQTAQLDGLQPKKLKARRLEKVLAAARSGRVGDLAKAELTLSRTFVSYVKAMRTVHRSPMIYESAALEPVAPSTSSVLQAAASAWSIEDHVASMAWMHPLYAPMRKALEDRRFSPMQRHQIYVNMERIRAIPADPGPRYLLIDTASARLWMYRNGRPVDSMRVVVGKPDAQTPTMAGFVRYAIVNPYWNIPVDLARSRIAANVLSRGTGYLREGGYQVLSDWSDKPSLVDPQQIDWKLVSQGALELRVRQLPGPNNFMGSVKFMFPNEQGIYLHDTPDRDLLRKESRQFSSGCVRLEDAGRLGRWLLGSPLPRRAPGPEHRIDLPQVVPIYITYLTAMPENGAIAFRSDVYAKDSIHLARNVAESR